MQAPLEQPLVSLLRSQGLSLLMRHFILHSVAMADADQEALVPEASSNVTAQHASSATSDTPARQTAAAASQSLAQSNGEVSGLRSGTSSSGSAPSPSSQEASFTVPASSMMSHTEQAAALPPASAAALVPASASAVPLDTAAAACPDRVLTVEQGVKALRQYLGSVGQYGPSSGAFLTPMYGCAELPQAFCRCAVFASLFAVCKYFGR